MHQRKPPNHSEPSSHGAAAAAGATALSANVIYDALAQAPSANSTASLQKAPDDKKKHEHQCNLSTHSPCGCKISYRLPVEEAQQLEPSAYQFADYKQHTLFFSKEQSFSLPVRAIAPSTDQSDFFGQDLSLPGGAAAIDNLQGPVAQAEEYFGQDLSLPLKMA